MVGVAKGAEENSILRELKKIPLEVLKQTQAEGSAQEYPEGFKNLMQKAITTLQKAKEKAAADLAKQQEIPFGATEGMKEEARKKARKDWEVTCANGLNVIFKKTGDFAGTFSEFTEDFAPQDTALAFDMDGTLAWMKEKDAELYHGTNLDTLQHNGDMQMVVVTAVQKSERNCNTVLQTLERDDTGPVIQQLFGLPAKCAMAENWHTLLDGSQRIVTDRQGQEEKFFTTKGLVMNEYGKAEGLVSYFAMPEETLHRGPPPKHVVFYDDYVKNPVFFAEHLCKRDKWPELQQVTAVWYATPEAEQKDRSTRQRMKDGKGQANAPSEGSFFSPNAEEDAQLAGARALFGEDSLEWK